MQACDDDLDVRPPQGSLRAHSLVATASLAAAHRRAPTAGIEAMASRAAELLGALGKLRIGRVLLLEPSSPALHEALRARGFEGACWSLTRRPRAAQALRRAAQASVRGERGETDRILLQEWPGIVTCDDADEVALATLDYGVFDAILACDALSCMSREQWSPLLRWISSLLTQRGIVLMREQLFEADVMALCAQLRPYGLIAIGDETWERARTHGGTRRALLTLQHRGTVECRRTGVLRRITREQVEHDKPLQTTMVALYREVFGGDEWREWMRCTAPDCSRQYSQRETAALALPSRCDCGATLRPFYTAADVLRELNRDLASTRRSCCYLHGFPGRTQPLDHGTPYESAPVSFASAGAADAFAWGYVCDLQHLTKRLLPGRQSKERRAFEQRVCDFVGVRTGDRPLLAFYVSQIGVRVEGRSFALLRALFTRLLQFAFEQGAPIVIGRTSRRTTLYPLLQGVGMRVMHDYAAAAALSGAPQHHLLDVDQRVLLGGDVARLRATFLGQSDRQITAHIAHELRERPAPLAIVRELRHPNSNRSPGEES